MLCLKYLNVSSQRDILLVIVTVHRFFDMFAAAPSSIMDFTVIAFITIEQVHQLAFGLGRFAGCCYYFEGL